MRRRKVSEKVAAVGRELDAQIAVRLMGWRWFAKKSEGLIALFPPDEEDRIMFSADLFEDVTGREEEYPRFIDWDGVGDVKGKRGLPHYSTDDAAALMVVDALMEREYDTTLRTIGTKHVFEMYKYARFVAAAEAWSRPEAICRAALACVAAEGGSTSGK
jgi:hypothetical protein